MRTLVDITDADIASVMGPQEFVESCDTAFRLYGLGEMLNPAREETLSRDGRLDLFRLELPGEWVGRFAGRKVIEERSDVRTGQIGDRTAVIELRDLETGDETVLDAEYITNMRTGAAGALGARYLADQPVKRIAILGTGRIARSLALCADVALQSDVICATSRKAENRDAFAEAIEPDVDSRVEMKDSIPACVAGADVILASVPTDKPILMRDMVFSDAHISVLGGDARTQQLDQALFLDRLIVPDHAQQVLNSGEFLAVEDAAAIRWAHNERGEKVSVSDVALGCMEFLRNRGAIAYFSGMAIQDIHAAATAWMRLRE